MDSITVLLTALASALMLYAWARQTRASAIPYHPGPKGWPLIGNALDVPQVRPSETYLEWSRIYGPVVHLNVFGKSMVVLNTAKAAHDLLDARSAIYSDRPRMLMSSMLGMEWNMAMMPYGPTWRKQRRVFHKYLSEEAIKPYQPLQTQKARKLLALLAKDSKNFMEHSRLITGATILELVYGECAEDPDHPYLKNAQDAVVSSLEAFLPGNLMVEFLPFLRYMPSWFPGTEFKKKLPKWRSQMIALREFASNDVNDTEKPSLVSRMLEEIADLESQECAEEEAVAQNVSAIMHLTGADSTWSTIRTFFLAMILYPDVQRKAQQELDRVVGAGRLPASPDSASLPYIHAVLKECIRWFPASSLGVAHAPSEDDVWLVRDLSATVLIRYSRAILHDPSVYPQPYVFNPDRFLKNGKLNRDAPDPNSAAVGFGRRICPGRHFSDAMLFITIASILHVFSISPTLDERGSPVYPDVQLDSVVAPISSYTPYDCIIKTRSRVAEQLLCEC
ncbi:hypothetical protein CERSUDRAFT_96445 [Gelatoporia subvermispora B]|uniref:Cytochrome P450 n=1 Tax=Ceriporiopsis subvermispora (strain B) TaxID=914234 RepID=M2R994_CERS8|nr:hypothetical protein CERSUDRAFT_96445 [Gelatoporia subvermispora B]